MQGIEKYGKAEYVQRRERQSTQRTIRSIWSTSSH